MTVEDRLTFRSIILPAESAPAAYRASQLLTDMGHDVVPAQSPDQASLLLQQDETDLLVVDISCSPRNREFLNTLVELSASARPRKLVIISDTMLENIRALRAKLSPTKVHIFLKPLHMHGLLNFLRSLDLED